MFEDICLQCGVPLPDDGSAYCSEQCSSNAVASPSVSSASSALSSPSFGFAQGGDVPPLVLPSVLGAALGRYKRDPYYLSSSSASSNSWSLATDEDEDDSAFHADRGLSYHDGMDSMYDGSSKSANFVYSLNPAAALSYARRPSGTNTHSTVPQVSNRSSSSSRAPNRRLRGTAHSAPINSQTDDSEEFSDSSRDVDSVDLPVKPSASRRTRKRDSLPSYFNLLRINSSTEAMKASPILSSSGNTVARVSPPTPRNIYPTGVPQDFEAPRGRRRHVDESRCSRRSQESSPSRSRSRHFPAESPRDIHRAVVGRDADQPRGRSTRRNSSPPSRMLGVDAPARVLSALRDAERSQSNSSTRRGRGRVHVDELEGVGCFPLAPGYGNGRSGLMDRSRMAALVDRVPV